MTRDVLQGAIDEGASEREIARAFGVTPRTVSRWMVSLGIREPRPVNRLTSQELERARLLSAEGMPLIWIAEDLDRAVPTLAEVVTEREKSISEWKQVWQQIRRSEILRELHSQFHPRNDRIA